jgi:hypothetical protein
VSDVSYDFTLALRRGDCYLGQATVAFTLNRMPKGKTPKFLKLLLDESEQRAFYINFSVQGLSQITINSKYIEGEGIYSNHRIHLSHVNALLKPG